MWPPANEHHNGDNQVGDHNGKHEEVKRRVEAGVALVVLRSWHSLSVDVKGYRHHSVVGAIGWGDGEEENWCARGHQRRMLDRGAACGGCRGEYVSVFQFEPTDVEELSGEAGRGCEDAGGEGEA